jgi:hypothetical protein
MLRGLRALRGHPFLDRKTLCLPADRRGIFCCAFDSRATPLAPSTCSSAARLIRLQRWLVRRGGREEGNSTGGFYEIPIDDRGGYRAGRHSERNFALG